MLRHSGCRSYVYRLRNAAREEALRTYILSVGVVSHEHLFELSVFMSIHMRRGLRKGL